MIEEPDFEFAQLTWYLGRDGYAARMENHRIVRLHRVITEALSGVEVDHVNRNRLDNRRRNLRFATRAENARNCKRSSRNTSGYKGVRFSPEVGRWGAAVRCDGKRYWMGFFDTPEEAALAYDLGAIALHRDFAATNFRITEVTRRAALDFGAFLFSIGECGRNH